MYAAFNMTSQDMCEALAYMGEEPYGAVREDLRIGQLLAMFHAANKGKDASVKNWYDFLPNGSMPEDAREELEAKLKAEAARKAKADREAKNKSLLERQAANAIAAFKAWNARWFSAQKKEGVK